MNKIITIYIVVLFAMLSCIPTHVIVKEPSVENTFFLGRNGECKTSKENTIFLQPEKGKLIQLHYDNSIDPNDIYIRKAINSFEKKAKLITDSQEIFTSFGGDGNSSHVYLKIDDNKLIQNLRGFTINSIVDDRTGNVKMSITSPTEVGILYALEYFNLNFLGFMETQPNKLIHHIDKTTSNIGYAYQERNVIYLPKTISVVNPGPDFDLRIWTGESMFNRTSWLQDEAYKFEIGTQLYQYHHNLFNVFKSSEKKNWQPQFSDKKNITQAKLYVDSMFTIYPHLKSVSLSVNDGAGYNPKDFKSDDNAKYNIANVYVNFVNEIARYTSKKWPEKYIAVLQYNKVANPSSIPYEKNVIVFLMNDIKAKYPQGKNYASKFGYYQWLYGRRYIFPNYGLAKLKDVLNWCIDSDIDIYKGEFYGAWAIDGLRIWVLSNLLWNSHQNLDKLVSYYLEKQFGPGAGNMTLFFESCEEVFNSKFEKYDIGISNTAYPGEYNFYELDIQKVERLRGFLNNAKLKIINQQKKNRREGNRYLFNIEASIKAFDWFVHYYQIYHSIYQRNNLTVSSIEEVHSELKNLNQAIKSIESLQNYFKDNLTGTAPYSIYSESYKEAEPRILWRDFEKNIDFKLSILNEYLNSNHSNEFVQTFWKESSNQYNDIGHLLTKYCKPPKLRNQKIVEYSFERKLEIDNGKMEKYLNRNVIDNISFIKDEEGTYISISGVGDYTGIKYIKQLKTNSTYTFSFIYKTLNTEEDSAILIASFAKNRQKREFIEPSKEWREKSIILSFDKFSRKDKIQGVYVILSLKNTNSLDQVLKIKNISIVEN